MTDHFQEIYDNKAALYDEMVAHEDYQGNIINALQRIRSLANLDVVEFGAGTGRLTRMIAPFVQSIQAFDISQHMLDTAAETLEKLGVANWQLKAADNQYLPVDTGSADLAIAGWSFGHETGWRPDIWRDEIGKSVDEMLRVLKPDGTAIILETMGTGGEQPVPPNQTLADYYAWLENERGFSYTCIRTDYQFESSGQADKLTRFFFGADLADRIIRENLTILPECTGIWWKHL